MQQAFLLAIGHYYPDDNNMLRIKGKRPLKNNKTIKYDTFLALEIEYFRSGIQVIRLNDENEIETWINAVVREDETIKERGNKKILYPPKSPKLIEPSKDLFQEIIEMSPDSIQSVASCGFRDLGQKRIDTIDEYAIKNNYDKWGIYFLKIMTDENVKGEAIHKVKGIGKGLRGKWRESLGLPPGYNLEAVEIEPDNDKAYNRGWTMALSVFKDKLENGKSGKMAFEETWEQVFEFYE